MKNSQAPLLDQKIKRNKSLDYLETFNKENILEESKRECDETTIKRSGDASQMKS